MSDRRAYFAAYYAANAEKKRAQMAAVYAADPEPAKERQRRWNAVSYPKARAANLKHYRSKERAARAKRRACLKNRTPKWADLDAIKNFYRNCPPGYHVDHVIPLQGRSVSGLHVIENLQYLLGPENCAKGNRFEA